MSSKLYPSHKCSHQLECMRHSGSRMPLFSQSKRRLTWHCLDTTLLVVAELSKRGFVVVELLVVGFVAGQTALGVAFVFAPVPELESELVSELVFELEPERGEVTWLISDPQIRTGPGTQRLPKHSIGRGRESHWHQFLKAEKHRSDAWPDTTHTLW